MKNLTIRNGVIDVTYLNDIVKDKRNFASLKTVVRNSG